MNKERTETRGTLQLLIGGGGGEPEMLLLLEPPQGDGRVYVRAWTSNDWSAPPATSERDATELLGEIERWAKHRTVNHPLNVVRQWLGG